MTRISIGLCALGTLLALAPASAFSDPITIVSETSGGTPDESPSVSNFEWLVTSWTTTNGYSNVAIAATVGCYSAPCSGTIEAYLTTAIGPTETVADQIATSTISFGLGPESETFFSGLSLTPGTYYLLLTNVGFESYWFGPGVDGPRGTTVTTNNGVTYDGDYLSGTGPDDFNSANPPASTWTYVGDRGLNFQVTGDAGSVVPEPGSISLVLIGVAGGICLFGRKLVA